MRLAQMDKRVTLLRAENTGAHAKAESGMHGPVLLLLGDYVDSPLARFHAGAADTKLRARIGELETEVTRIRAFYTDKVNRAACSCHACVVVGRIKTARLRQIKEVERKAAATAQAMRRAGGMREAPAAPPVSHRAVQRPATAAVAHHTNAATGVARRGAAGGGGGTAGFVPAHAGGGVVQDAASPLEEEAAVVPAGASMSTQIPQPRIVRHERTAGGAAGEDGGEPLAGPDGSTEELASAIAAAQAAASAAEAAASAATAESRGLRDALAAAAGRADEYERRHDAATKVRARALCSCRMWRVKCGVLLVLTLAIVTSEDCYA